MVGYQALMVYFFAAFLIIVILGALGLAVFVSLPSRVLESVDARRRDKINEPPPSSSEGSSSPK